ncbi:Ribosomal subunit interface protein [Candidatus Rhodobacter oscarellae]|uniref:Ribosome hibernation promoting factor n=1 Tax=Candidatus Rhodobacter oscarellae TaxID=1675527 RepID=A0A0J9E7T0_9RHOB|nr:ribosome-associated translation inhibitor RaiA [Candidatus Rhodobacter lobularis]KMW58786.1 Ribosomal subunit interface protein [Candidatus Rhodobacter lobularis]
MHYQITGKQIDIGESLQERTRVQLDATLEKYPGRPTDVTATYSRNGHVYACEVVVHLSTGLTVNARGQDSEIYSALDNAVEKVDKQLRRYKRRLKDHHRVRETPVALSGGSTYILAARKEEQEPEPDTLQPMIVAEMETKIPSLSVGEAVMQMELAGAPVLVFRKEGDDRLNVVYHREDGNIGWIDPGH